MMAAPAAGLRGHEASADRIQALEEGLSAYLTDRWNKPSKVTEMMLVPGGAARATWRCSLVSAGTRRGLIVRLDSGTQLLPIEERAEYLTMSAAHKAGLPVPEPLVFAEDSRWLGRPFSITSEVPNCKTSPDQIPPEHRSKIGRRFWGVLGEMTKFAPQTLGIDRFLATTTPETCVLPQCASTFAEVDLVGHDDITRTMQLKPMLKFQQKGIGYGHPKWGHGLWRGDLSIEHECFDPEALDPLAMENIHVQQVVRASDGRRDGVGTLEQFIIGYSPAGFDAMLDGAKE
jgi:hypothetical protein